MTPQQLLEHFDNGQLWPPTQEGAAATDVALAYQRQLALRQLRIDRGELPRGFKIGFTNRGIWPRYNVFAPIWGTVWNTSLIFCEGRGLVSLRNTCQPRIEPETVFGMCATPPPGASLDDLFDAIDWVAPGFEIVQSHLPDWKFTPADAVADGGLHARLLIGRRIARNELGSNPAELQAALAGAKVVLRQDKKAVDRGVGANVLDGPLLALQHFLRTLHPCPGAPDVLPGDVVTTGTWTDAWPVEAGQSWVADFSAPLSRLQVRFE
ncbi:MAG: hydratase [Betaproteobacteria bacterium]